MGSDELKPLSKKHSKILDEYLLCFNQWRAYKTAFPNVTDDSARSLSSILFANVNFQAHLNARLNEVHMSANEALRLTSDIAKGDITNLLSPLGIIDLDKIREGGHGRLIKKIKQRTITKIGKGEKDEDTEIHDVEIELYDAQAAQRDILKITGRYKEQVDITSGGDKIKGFIGWSPTEWESDDKK